MTIIDLSKFQKVSLSINVSLVYVALGLLISLQPPFYPSEAEKMGATPAQYGFVFGIANLSLFIFSPIFGKYGPRLGAKLCFTTGSIFQGVSGFLFAFLPLLKNCEVFITLSYVLRFAEGFGTAMAWSAAVGILMKLFPNKVAQIMSWTQTFFGLGYMMGPAVGAALYEVGGFKFPFLVVGSISTILSVSLYFTIPHMDDETRHVTLRPDGQEQPRPVLGFRQVLSSFSLLLPFFDLFCTLCGNGVLESMLEPHLRQYKATTLDVGITFLIFGCCYMSGNVIFGTIADKVGNPTVFSVLGNCLFLLTFSLIGPVPFVPVKPSVILIQLMMACAGTAYASMVVSSFGRAHQRVIKMGFADDLDTRIMITGLWMSAFALGNFVGPTFAGFLVQSEGFSSTTVVFFGLYLVMALVDSAELCQKIVSRRMQNSYEEIP
ncbi:hypothetical protein TCAL_04819 [Tigriopus californicus]|uniref:Major facilitator superfamily (MFS) profile domain-containing protein n=1 Tax=Tigriopus californicus TaxID=6832 RepID=A0A553NZD1_TIGCA|nr:hypothetical protein TCAL_04819 [Tigriopus californicus]|eukprot:TCALIF_04819-PA protein Name:"Similar to Slc18b1 MFS-type transporter SLC18B1 (Mus musculus)" AED:0.02 eAED:0.02 QI:58/1/1/1/0.37/0.55/9/320/433